MAPKTHPLLASQATRGRVVTRAQIGRLQNTVVKPRTLVGYNAACKWFFTWMIAMQLALPAEVWEFDVVICEAIEAAWAEGENRNLIGNLLSGIVNKIPAIRGNLRGSWRLWSAWGKQELPLRAPPFTPDMVLAMAGIMLAWSMADVTALLLLGYDCSLRTNELLTIQRQHMTFNATFTSVVAHLVCTKTTSRHGGIESVTRTEPNICRYLGQVCKSLLPGDAVLQRSVPQFRIAFDKALACLGLDRSFRPYSLRRGGASHFFRCTGSMDATMERGRWGDQRTARIYVNTALLELSSNRLSPEVTRNLFTAAAIFAARKG